MQPPGLASLACCLSLAQAAEAPRSAYDELSPEQQAVVDSGGQVFFTKRLANNPALLAQQLTALRAALAL